ncbi:hypothetical protein KC19_VG155300 [Ceratodon purpureus]|uniref:Uncharacterized protein n=1 Tax=Ceratodon purpureus TaxID=3225 RepID=A0A8T0HQD7_CERPU|nr:hypothetical protein KC19_VG155300 [Ceratodon purpureus]
MQGISLSRALQQAMCSCLILPSLPTFLSAKTTSLHTRSEPVGSNDFLKSFAAFAPLSDGLLGILLEVPDNSLSLKILAAPPCILVADKLDSILDIAASCVFLSRIVHTYWMCK